MYKRFFSFGCSFTHYIWPTWADIIAYDTKLPFENWGKSGSGNFLIQSKIIECDFKNQLTKDDLVIITWTTWQREDRFLQGNWQAHGSVFNNHIYDKEFIKKYWSEENDYIKNIVAIHSTQRSYQDIIKFSGTFYLPDKNVEEYNVKSEDSRQMKKIIETFYDKFQKPVLILPNMNGKKSYENHVEDGHPDILDHLGFIENFIYPALNLKVKHSTIEWCKEYYNEVISNLSIKDDRFTVCEKIFEINKKFNLNLVSTNGIT